MINGRNVFFRCQSLLADLPCKCQLLNHMQFNAYYGCTHCFIPGQYDKSLHTMIFEPWSPPFNIDYIELARIAEANHQPAHGIKGVSVLRETLNYQITKKVPFDAIHLIFEGHTKFILKRLVPKYGFICIFNYINFLESFFSKLLFYFKHEVN